MRLTRLRLQDFRNYRALSWNLDPGPQGRITVITGPNGSGKTNLLEAVSLLVPGRGLRGARTASLARATPEGTAPSWGIAARLATAEGALALGTGCPPGSPDRREFRLDGATPRSQAEIAARLAVVWLTPQMDTLFTEPASGRRRFLDRLVYALEPGHARQIAAHDTAQAQRAKLLAAGGADPAWLAGLEDAIARHAVAATAARLSLVDRLNAALAADAAAGFPPARMALLCPIGDRLAEHPALEVEDWLRAALRGSRGLDATAGSPRLGAQRADMALADAQTGRTAERASTGERRALLIGVVLGHAALIAGLRGAAPILLLDEPMVHLDADRRQKLCAAAGATPAQFLMTGTDPHGFHALAGIATFLHAQDGTLHP